MKDINHYKHLLETRLNELYRITPARRKMLEREKSAAEDSAKDSLNQMQQSGSREDAEKAVGKMTRITRINAIRQMGLPVERRTGTFAGQPDEVIKNIMGMTRATERSSNPRSNQS